jgi:phasin family protein
MSLAQERLQDGHVSFAKKPERTTTPREGRMANPRHEKEATRHEKETVGQTVTRKMADETSSAVRTMADLGERAARAGSDVIQQNAEAAQQAWQSASEVATRLTERSTEQFAFAFGIMGGEAQQKAAQRSSRNLEAIVQSSAILASGAQSISHEWFDFARNRTEQNFGRLDAMMHCRTPQEITAVQIEVVRENLEDLLQSTRRIAEVSMQTVDEAVRKMTESVEAARRAA